MKKRVSLSNERSIELVQRIKSSDNEDKRGVDRFFSYDYMGSAEFEFGALGYSLSRIRDDMTEGGLILKPHHVKFRYRGPGLPAYSNKSGQHIPLVETGKEFSFTFVGPEEFIPGIRELFEIQAIRKLCGLKERTEIDVAYGLDPYCRNPGSNDLFGKTIGWWDIKNDWAAFKNAKFAHQWLEGLNDYDRSDLAPSATQKKDQNPRP